MDIPIEPKQLFFTSTGHIGIIAEMNEEFSLCMTALQRNMSTYYERKEGISHARFGIHLPLRIIANRLCSASGLRKTNGEEVTPRLPRSVFSTGISWNDS